MLSGSFHDFDRFMVFCVFVSEWLCGFMVFPCCAAAGTKYVLLAVILNPKVLHRADVSPFLFKQDTLFWTGGIFLIPTHFVSPPEVVFHFVTPQSLSVTRVRFVFVSASLCSCLPVKWLTVVLFIYLSLTCWRGKLEALDAIDRPPHANTGIFVRKTLQISNIKIMNWYV